MDPFLIRQSVDLQRENCPMRYEQPLLKGNKNAHKWCVTVTNGGEAADLTGVTGTLWLTYGVPSGDGEMSAIAKASVEGNVASVVFPASCYVRAGEAIVVLELASGEATIGVAVMTLRVRETKANVVIDEDDIVPDIDELVVEISNVKAATAAANAAAYTANTAANAANSSARANPYINTENNHWMTWDAEAGAYTDTGILATGPQGAAGEDGTNGVTPHIGENGNWWIGSTDTGVKAQGPAGANGTGSGTVTGVKLNGNTHTPDQTGLVDLGTHTAEDVGAAAANHTHTAEDVGAAAANHTHTAEDVGAATAGHTHTAAEIGAASMTRILTAANFSLNANVTFTDSPDNYKFTIGRLAYAGTTACFPAGSDDARKLHLSSMMRNDISLDFYNIVLTGTKGGTVFKLETISKYRVQLQTGDIEVSTPTSINIGDIYGVK